MTASSNGRPATTIMRDERALKLMAYADGELEGAELAEVQKWIEEDAESVLFANDLAELGDLLKTGHPTANPAIATFDIADSVMAKLDDAKVIPLSAAKRSAPVQKKSTSGRPATTTIGIVVAGLALAASVFFIVKSQHGPDEAPLARTTSPLVQPGSVAAAVSAGTVDVENPGSSVSVIYVPDEQTPNVTTVVWVNENGAK